MKLFCTRLAVLLALFLSPLAQAEGLPRSASPEGARVYIISPADGEVVPATFTVRFGLAGMGVAPAGVDREHTGHHHLLVDGAELPATDRPMGAEVQHFGAGQTQTTLTLPKGSHTLQLILGDRYHVPHQPPVVSERITVHVR